MECFGLFRARTKQTKDYFYTDDEKRKIPEPLLVAIDIREIEFS
jgi:hypothetical protein